MRKNEWNGNTVKLEQMVLALYEEEIIVDLYEGEATVDDICNLTDRSRSKIYRILRRHKVTLRSKVYRRYIGCHQVNNLVKFLPLCKLDGDCNFKKYQNKYGQHLKKPRCNWNGTCNQQDWE